MVATPRNARKTVSRWGLPIPTQRLTNKIRTSHHSTKNKSTKQLKKQSKFTLPITPHCQGLPRTCLGPKGPPESSPHTMFPYRQSIRTSVGNLKDDLTSKENPVLPLLNNKIPHETIDESLNPPHNWQFRQYHLRHVCGSTADGEAQRRRSASLTATHTRAHEHC
jgi:hypothetical protein